MEDRISWDQYFMNLANQVATRSTCVRRKVGAVAVDDRNMIIGTGYNGSPSGFTHCTKETCIRCIRKIPSGQMTDLCRAIHAEQNLVVHLGEKLKGSTVYCTTKPCTTCTKLLIGCGVKHIVWRGDYDDDFASSILKEYTGTEFYTDGHGYKHAIKTDNVKSC